MSWEGRIFRGHQTVRQILRLLRWHPRGEAVSRWVGVRPLLQEEGALWPLLQRGLWRQTRPPWVFIKYYHKIIQFYLYYNFFFITNTFYPHNVTHSPCCRAPEGPQRPVPPPERVLLPPRPQRVPHLLRMRGRAGRGVHLLLRTLVRWVLWRLQLARDHRQEGVQSWGLR